jgi:hypothetical protein
MLNSKDAQNVEEPWLDIEPHLVHQRDHPITTHATQPPKGLFNQTTQQNEEKE